MPNGGTGEAIDDGWKVIPLLSSWFQVEKLAASLGGLDQFSSSSPTNTLRFAIAPNIGRQDRFVTFIDVVANRLADEVIGDREASEPVVGE